MHLSIEFLHFSNGSGAPDGWRDVKRLDWLSVVECLRGRYIYSCNASPAVTINPGEAFIAPAGALQDILHRTDKDGIFECRYVFIDAVCDGSRRLDELYSFPSKLPDGLSEAMHNCLLRLNELPESSYCLRMSQAYLILDILLRCGTRKPDCPAIDKALHYIRSNYALPITVADLCRHLAVSEATLFRLFRRHLHCTPVSCINSVRISMAARLLLNGCSVEAAAEQCGFNNSAYFYRVFRSSTGITPGQYRRNGSAI